MVDSIALRRLSRLSQSDNSMISVSTNEFRDVSVDGEQYVDDVDDNNEDSRDIDPAYLSVAAAGYNFSQRRCSAPNFGLSKLMESLSEKQLSDLFAAQSSLMESNPAQSGLPQSNLQQSSLPQSSLSQSSLSSFTNCSRFTSRRHSSPQHMLHNIHQGAHAQQTQQQQNALPLQRAILA